MPGVIYLGETHMDTATSAFPADAPLYPPTITPPDRPLPLYRMLPTFVANPLRATPRQAYEDDLVVFAATKTRTIVWLTAPALVERVLVADAAKVVKSPAERRVLGTSLAGSILLAEGADWRWQRRALAPLFRAADIQTYVPAMVAAAEAQVGRWRTAARQGADTRAIDDDMMAATFDVITATMLVGGRPADADTILKAGSDYLARASWPLAYALLQFPEWLPHPATWAMRRAAEQMRTAVSAIVARRRAEGGTPQDMPPDLLGRLLEARHPDTGEPMPNDLVVSNLLTLLEAGHETTAKALTWTLYLLARSPHWQARVHDEIVSVAGDGPLTPPQIARLAVTTRVIKEAMRLYPPAPVIARINTEPMTFTGADGVKHRLPTGTQMIIPIFAIHRHRKLWDDPDRFDPDRFLPAAEAGRPRTQYMPFGGGPRVCIGAQFAMTEAIALLATFVRAARFDWDGHHLPEPISRVTLRPKGGMPLKVVIR
jgi:cytochrome P450